MLLSKLPVLDKGYVALIDSCNTSKKLRDIDEEYFNSRFPAFLLDLGSMTLAIKCPLFVQLNLCKFNFKVINTETSRSESPSGIEAYEPTAGEIGASDRSVSDLISEDIRKTTAALLMNPIAYRTDGADRFISQIITPLSVYTTLIVQGSYDEWCKFCDQNKAPMPIKAYMDTIKQIKDAEWK
jgi:hypothetical protein